MGATVSSFSKTAMSFMYSQEDPEVLTSFQQLRDAESQPIVSIEDELINSGFVIGERKPVETASIEDLTEMVVEQLEALKSTRDALDSQVLIVKADLAELEQRRKKLVEERRTCKAKAAAKYQANIESQRKLMEHLQTQKKQRESGLKRSSR